MYSRPGDPKPSVDVRPPFSRARHVRDEAKDPGGTGQGVRAARRGIPLAALSCVLRVFEQLGLPSAPSSPLRDFADELCVTEDQRLPSLPWVTRLRPAKGGLESRSPAPARTSSSCHLGRSGAPGSADVLHVASTHTKLS